MQGPCDVSGKLSGPCKIKPKEKSFFIIDLIEFFEDYAVVPCYVREQFNKVTSSRVTFVNADNYMYTVEVDVQNTVTVLCGAMWEQFVLDYGLSLGDNLIFSFPKENNHAFYVEISDNGNNHKMRVDNSVPYDEFNSTVDYKLADVVYTKGICLSDEERNTLKHHIANFGPGAASFFVHSLTKTNMKEGMKFPEPIANGLRTGTKGDILFYTIDPEVDTEMKFRIDSDGRFATVGSTMWKDFVVKAGLKENDHVSFLIFKERSLLVVCVMKI